MNIALYGPCELTLLREEGGGASAKGDAPLGPVMDETCGTGC